MARYRRCIARAVLLAGVGAVSLSAADQPSAHHRVSTPKQTAAPRVTEDVEYCIVYDGEAFTYVTDGFGNTKHVRCPYPVQLRFP
jgi:hypothetical protein